MWPSARAMSMTASMRPLSPRRFLACGSIKFEHREHGGGGDLIDPDVAARPCVLAKRLPPLPHVLLVFPRRLVRGDELVGHYAERRRECDRLHDLPGALPAMGSARSPSPSYAVRHAFRALVS
jgi:hypothetical protein